nr:unnamed protein product [Digitaria exilis]
MDAKPYILAIIIVAIYTGMFVISKAAFNQGMNSFVFVFYRQAAASLFLLPTALVLERKNVESLSLRLLVKLFFLVLIGMEVVKLKTSSGIAKVTGVALCLAGALTIAFYTGQSLRPINHHRAFGAHPANASKAPSHAVLLKQFPNKMLITTVQCVLSMMQSFVVAAVAERDFTKWKLRFDISLLAVAYTGFVVTGVSYYLQAWCVEIKGPVFLAVWNPLCFVLTIFCSSFFLGEIVHLGR